jgi:divalent metal cation (Fe/Co/Zn/Cd) transporter
MKAACGIFRDATRKMIDEACDSQTIREIQDIAGTVEGVLQVDMVKTRLFGSKKYVDIEISADGEHSLVRAHEIAHQVHDVVEEEIDGVKHCMVHVNPL